MEYERRFQPRIETVKFGACKHSILKGLLLLILALVSSDLFAQMERTNISLSTTDSVDFSFEDTDFVLDSSKLNSLDGAKAEIERFIELLRMNGYPLANLDSISKKGDGYHGWLFIGEKNEKAVVHITYSEDSDHDVAKHLADDLTLGKDIALSEISSLIVNLVERGENNGYPFTQSKIKRGYLDNGLLRLEVQVSFGPKIEFGNIKIGGFDNIKIEYLAAHLDIREGSPFDQSKVAAIPKRIDELEFLKLEATPEVNFENRQGIVNLELSPVKSNRFDAVIGILPNGREGDKLLVTGVLDLSLKNLFRSGKQLDLFWNGYQVQSQTLDIGYSHPNLLFSNAGLNFKFSLLKQDSSFVRRQLMFGLDFKPTEKSRMRIFSNWQSSVVLNDLNLEPNSMILDYSGVYFGFILQSAVKQPLSIISRKSFRYYWESSFGSKSVEDDLLMLENRTNQFSARMHVEYLAPMTRSVALYISGKAGHIENSQRLLNDQFRLGGLKSIRGFNDNEFFATTYFIGRLETRAYLSDESYFLAFYDQAFLSLNVDDPELIDFPLGFGMGMSLATKSGQFTLVYALGQSNSQNISVNESRIHFGYIAVF